MTKKDLVREVAKRMETVLEKKVTIKDTTVAVDAMFDEIEEALAHKDEVKIAGFGTFVTVDKEARTGRNPATGETIEIPAKVSVKFKPAASLKKTINA